MLFQGDLKKPARRCALLLMTVVCIVSFTSCGPVASSIEKGGVPAALNGSGPLLAPATAAAAVSLSVQVLDSADYAALSLSNRRNIVMPAAQSSSYAQFKSSGSASFEAGGPVGSNNEAYFEVQGVDMQSVDWSKFNVQLTPTGGGLYTLQVIVTDAQSSAVASQVLSHLSGITLSFGL